MGLEEKRAIQEFETNEYPNWKKQFDEITGYDVPVECKWDTMVPSAGARYFGNIATKAYFDPFAFVLRAICKDQMGKDALKSGLKKVVFCSNNDTCTFENGVLTYDHKPEYNGAKMPRFREDLQKIIEGGL